MKLGQINNMVGHINPTKLLSMVEQSLSLFVVVVENDCSTIFEVGKTNNSPK